MPFDLGNIRVKLGLDNSGLERGLGQSEKSIQGFGKSVGRIAGLIGVAFGTKELLEFGGELTNLNERFTNVRRSFDQTGLSLEQLRTSTGGAVSDFQLLQSSVQAVNLGLPVDKLASAFEFATKRAAETGESVDYLVNSIVLGIGRQSPLILDNLGINAKEVRDRFQETGDFAQAAFEIIERESGKSQVSLENAATSTQKLSTAWENFKVTLSEFVEGPGSGVIDFLSELTKTAGQFLKDFRDPEDVPLEEQITKTRDSLIALKESIDIVKKSDLSDDEKVKQLTFLANEAERLGKRLDILVAQQAGRDAFEAGGRAAENAAPKVGKLADSYRSLQEVIDNLTSNISVSAELDPVTNLINQNLVSDITPVNIGELLFPEEAAQLSIQESIDEAFKAVDSAVQANVAGIKGKVEGATLDIGNFLANSFSTLGEQLGDAFTEGFDGSSFLEALASFGESFGKQLIAIGVASLALKTTIKNPLAAIAAGIGLIAVSRAIKNTASQAQSTLSSIGNTGSSRAFNVGGFSSDPGGVQPIIVRVGDQDFVSAYDRSRNYVQRTTGLRRG